jgi:hypothetical protein
MHRTSEQIAGTVSGKKTMKHEVERVGAYRTGCAEALREGPLASVSSS